MGKTEVTLTLEQANIVFVLASDWRLPKEMGQGSSYSASERSQADRELWRLWRELRAYSPLAQSEERLKLVGPAECYKKIKNEKGREGYTLQDQEYKVRLKLDEESLSGLMWTFIAFFHPDSGVSRTAHEYNLLWDLVEKLKRVETVRKETGLTQAKPRRWEDDPQSKTEEAEAPESEKISEQDSSQKSS